MEKVVHLVFTPTICDLSKAYKKRKFQQRSVQLVVNVRFLQCNQRESSPVPSSLHSEFSSAQSDSSDFTATQTNSNSTLSSTSLKSKGESVSKFSLKLRLRNQLDQPSELRISHLTSTISKITTRTQLTTFAPLDSINHRANFIQGNYKGTIKS